MAEGNFFPGPTEEEIIIALGYTPENVANKATDFSVINDTKYPTTEATNNQIIASLSSVSSYFFYKTSSDIATYYQMTNVAPTGSSQSFTGTGLAVGEHVLASFATNSGYPNKTFYPSGWTTGHIHAEKASGGVVSLRMDTYKRAVGGTETLICSSDLSVALTTSPVAYSFDAYNASIVTMNTSDRIVTKVVAVVSSGTPNVTIYVEDAYLSRTNLPVQQTLYSDYFYNGAYASKPDPSTLADGITAWFTDRPNSQGGSFVVRSTSTPGTKIWDRVGGGPVAIDTWAALLDADADTPFADQTLLLCTDGATFPVRKVSGVLQPQAKVYNGDYALRPAANLYPAGVQADFTGIDDKTFPRLFFNDPVANLWHPVSSQVIMYESTQIYIFTNPSGWTYTQSGTTVTVNTGSAHSFPSDLPSGTKIYLSNGSGTLLAGWFSNFVNTGTQTFTCESAVSANDSGTLAANASETMFPLTRSLKLLNAGVQISFSLYTRVKNNANTKTFKHYLGSIACSSSSSAANALLQSIGTNVLMLSPTTFVRIASTDATVQTMSDSNWTAGCTMASAGDWAAAIMYRCIFVDIQ